MFLSLISNSSARAHWVYEDASTEQHLFISEIASFIDLFQKV